jgi:transposase
MLPHKHIIRLNGSQKQTLRQLKRPGNVARRMADRARIILWTADAVAVAEIASRLEISPSTVINWRCWFLERSGQGLSYAACLSDRPRSGRPPNLDTKQMAQIKAIACEQPAKLHLPLSRFSLGEIVLWIKQAGIVTDISTSSVWRFLHHDALRPWYYRAWLFPRDADFATKAGRVLDLYQHIWQGQPLGVYDYVLSSDEKSAIQVLERRHPTLPPLPGEPGRYEFEYKRNGTLAYLAALDVFTGHVYGSVQDTTGIGPFDSFVASVMQREPYASAERVFWIMDGGPSHHPNTSPARLQAAHANLIAVHLPTHASWLNQIELYFSIVQRKALTPMDAPDKTAVIDRIMGFQERYDQTAKPFRWNFTRADLQKRLQTIADPDSKNL